MLFEAIGESTHSAHVIVLGNEKGGTGKSTMAMHIAVALLKAGQRVVTIDLDSRQGTLSSFIGRRRVWAERPGLALAIPQHFRIARAGGLRLDDNEAAEFASFEAAICAVQHACDFVVIDTPSADSYLMRLAHAAADTLVTPINNSFLDFDVLGRVDAETLAVTGRSHYAELARDLQRRRRVADGGLVDWIVMRNRMPPPGTRNAERIGEALEALRLRLGFRVVDGLPDCAAYADFFVRGLIALDLADEPTLSPQLQPSHDAAGEEMAAVLAALKLPLDERGRRRLAARQEWLTALKEPLDLSDILA
jgi:chromosome partitioning protein